MYAGGMVARDLCEHLFYNFARNIIDQHIRNTDTGFTEVPYTDDKVLFDSTYLVISWIYIMPFIK